MRRFQKRGAFEDKNQKADYQRDKPAENGQDDRIFDFIFHHELFDKVGDGIKKWCGDSKDDPWHSFILTQEVSLDIDISRRTQS